MRLTELTQNKYIVPKRYNGAKVVVAVSLPNLVGDMWGGSWNISPIGEIIIFIERKFVDACIKHNMSIEIENTISHEYYECKRAIILARSKYPKLNPYLMAEKDTNLGGEAHLLTVKEHNKMSEGDYDRMLNKLYAKIGL